MGEFSFRADIARYRPLLKLGIVGVRIVSVSWHLAPRDVVISRKSTAKRSGQAF